MRATAISAICIVLGGCGLQGDRVTPLPDGCTFLVEFQAKCVPAGKTGICTQRPPILVKSQSAECSK